jgi:hypothetical protein
VGKVLIFGHFGDHSYHSYHYYHSISHVLICYYSSFARTMRSWLPIELTIMIERLLTDNFLGNPSVVLFIPEINSPSKQDRLNACRKAQQLIIRESRKREEAFVFAPPLSGRLLKASYSPVHTCVLIPPLFCSKRPWNPSRKRENHQSLQRHLITFST